MRNIFFALFIVATCSTLFSAQIENVANKCKGDSYWRVHDLCEKGYKNMGLGGASQLPDFAAAKKNFIAAKKVPMGPYGLRDEADFLVIFMDHYRLTAPDLKKNSTISYEKKLIIFERHQKWIRPVIYEAMLAFSAESRILRTPAEARSFALSKLKAIDNALLSTDEIPSDLCELGDSKLDKPMSETAANLELENTINRISKITLESPKQNDASQERSKPLDALTISKKMDAAKRVRDELKRLGYLVPLTIPVTDITPILAIQNDESIKKLSDEINKSNVPTKRAVLYPEYSYLCSKNFGEKKLHNEAILVWQHFCKGTSDVIHFGYEILNEDGARHLYLQYYEWPK